MKISHCLEINRKLRAGTEIEEFEASQHSKFEERVLQRNEQLTNKFLDLKFLESTQDGGCRKTKEFKDIWESREEYVSTARHTCHDSQQR